MKILWVSDKGPVHGGGSTSERILLNYMAKTDHDINHIVATELHGGSIARGPFELRMEILGKILKVYLTSRIRRSMKPDVFVSHGNYYPWVGDVASKFGIPHLVFIRDHYYCCPGAKHTPCKESCWQCLTKPQRVLWLLLKYQRSRRMKELSKCDMVIANSHFMRKSLEKVTDKPVNVLYPPIELNKKRNIGSHDKIVYLGCGSYKGTEVVMKLAKSLPQYEFLLAGDPDIPRTWDLGEYPNVEWSPWIDNTIAFDTARLMLVPSQWHEPFGRVAIEAGVHYVPTLGSDIGGIPESVHDGGSLLPPDRFDMWKKRIIEFMENDTYRRWEGIDANLHSRNFSIDSIGPQFEHYLEEL